MLAIWIWSIAVAVLAVLVAAMFLWPIVARRRREAKLASARGEFQRRREWLEAHFLTLASGSGRPRGLSWKDCEFDNGVVFARARDTGGWRAFVAVTISFEAIEGGGMEDNPNVGNLRAATAVFEYEQGEWRTQGRALFNLNPSEAIEHFHHELEGVD